MVTWIDVMKRDTLLPSWPLYLGDGSSSAYDKNTVYAGFIII